METLALVSSNNPMEEARKNLFNAVRTAKAQKCPVDEIAQEIVDGIDDFDDITALIEAIQEAIACPMGICDGSGEVTDYHHDPDSHQTYPDGTKPCPHTIREPEDDEDRERS